MLLAPQDQRTFFVTSVTNGRRAVLQSERMASLFIDVLVQNRDKGRFLLHEFVVMPDHFLLLITPERKTSLEKAVQYIKGGFSFRAARELDFKHAIWQESFTNHRIKDSHDYEEHRTYIRENPVQRRLVKTPDLFPYSSASPNASLDPPPPWLKPS
ncbi:MAG TPA: transposase [Verrucomicrobiae bacterium]|nr:transposase [Verrucomicrobiae bacterium]